MEGLGKMLLLAGGLLVLMGLALLFLPRIPFLGKLPGDIQIEGKYGGFYFPIVTCLLISLILTVLLNLFFRR